MRHGRSTIGAWTTVHYPQAVSPCADSKVADLLRFDKMACAAECSFWQLGKKLVPGGDLTKTQIIPAATKVSEFSAAPTRC